MMTGTKSRYSVVYDTPNFIDGIDCDTLLDAICTAREILIGWMQEETEGWEDLNNPTPEEIERWNDMIYNCAVWIEEYDPATNDYEELDSLTDEELRLIGWVEIPEVVH